MNHQSTRNYISDTLKALSASLLKDGRLALGYPVAKDFDYGELTELLHMSLNNCGDPFVAATYKADTRKLETEVLDFYARLFRIGEGDYWGYVTNGGSESNLYGLYLARSLYPTAMVYYSEATHYSVRKNLHLLNMPNITIRAQTNGEIDYEDLENTLRLNRDKPAVLLCNIGTTMTEARDDLSRIKAILQQFAIRDHYIHVDGALSGNYTPFLEPRPAFDFKDGADSIAISGHKFIGMPFPCGVVICRKEYRDRIARSVAYTGTPDTTVTGSRNGHSPLFLWYAIQKLGLTGLRERAQKCLDLAAYAEIVLKNVELKTWRNPNTLTISFPAPTEQLISSWQLATQDGWSHIICMPGVTTAQIDQFAAELAHSKTESHVNDEVIG